jgi:uridine kinase
MIDIEALLPRTSDPVWIAIDGHGGSGKSTLAALLSARFNATIIHTDDFASWENPFRWSDNIIGRIFEPVRTGAATLSYPRSSWWEDHYPEPIEDQGVTAVMIIEGVGSSRHELDPYLALRLFVDTPEEVCLARGIARDRQTGKSEAELREIWMRWIAAENEFYMKEHPRERADVILDGTLPFETQIAL